MFFDDYRHYPIEKHRVVYPLTYTLMRFSISTVRSNWAEMIAED